MIIRFCDYCGRRCDRGTHIRQGLLSISPNRTKRHAKDHDEWRYVRAVVQIGIDGINPGNESADGDLCLACKRLVLLEILEQLDTEIAEATR